MRRPSRGLDLAKVRLAFSNLPICNLVWRYTKIGILCSGLSTRHSTVVHKWLLIFAATIDISYRIFDPRTIVNLGRPVQGISSLDLGAKLGIPISQFRLAQI